VERDLDKEAWCWQHATSEAFFRGAADACRAAFEAWPAETAWERHARELDAGIESARRGDYEAIHAAAERIAGTAAGGLHRGMTGQIGDEWSRRAAICAGYAEFIRRVLARGLFGGALWRQRSQRMKPEIRGRDIGPPGDAILRLLDDPPNGYPHFRRAPPPERFPHYAPDFSRAVKSGAPTPWTGVWIPAPGLERRSLTFAIAGRPMTCSWKIVCTREERRAELLQNPEYRLDEFGLVVDADGNCIDDGERLEIEEMTWYPLLPQP
jgi:hypothetical protein